MDYQFLTERLRTEEEFTEYLKTLLNNEENDDITTDPEYIDDHLTFLDKGVFWLVKDKHGNERLAAYKYAVSAFELFIDKHKYSHEQVWKSLDKSITQNKPYYYFPRGRYEIRKGNKVVIYCSTFFADEKYKKMLLAKLKLRKGYKGIQDIKFIFDNSLHYRYLFDE